MNVGPEGETVGFVKDMEHLDEAVRMMTAMLNRFNKAVVYLGLNRNGESLGARFTDDDSKKILERIDEKVNHKPDVQVTVSPEGDYITITAQGYETPYSFGSWFYVRRYRYVKNGDSADIVWTENLTCGMKRHRIKSVTLPITSSCQAMNSVN